MQYLARIQIPDLGVVTALSSGAEPPSPGSRHVVESGGFQEIGTVLETSTATRSAADAVSTRILRAVTDADAAAEAEAAVRAAEALQTFGQLLERHGVAARPVKSHFSMDRKRLVAWYLPQSAPTPDLKPLEGEFRRKARAASVDLRAASPREAAAMLGGVGCCGRQLCCASWLRGTPQSAPSRNASSTLLSNAGICGQGRCCHSFS